MLYVSLLTLKKTIEKGVNFSLTVEPKVPLFNEKGGVSINFLEKHPYENEGGDIIFHFNPRPPRSIVINTFWKGAWQSEVILKDDDVRDELFGKAFVLTIKERMQESEVNGKVIVGYPQLIYSSK